MTQKEYEQKLEAYRLSDADPSIKAAAIQKLHDDFFGARARALKIITESAPEPIKGD